MDKEERSLQRMTRRDMLKLSGLAIAGGVLVGCGAAPAATSVPQATKVPEATKVAPTAAPVTGNVVLMFKRAELSEEQQAQFQAANPGITVEFIEDDQQRLFSMYAAGTPPDVWRTQGPDIPQNLARNLLYDLTPYFQASAVLKMDDLASANQYYMASSPTEIGKGKIYGMCKDWSPDFTLFAYTPAFEEAGVQLPADTASLTYAQVMELAGQLTKKEGDRILRWGYGYGDWWTDRIWMNMLNEVGQKLYSEDFKKMTLVGNADATAIAQYYFELAQKNYVANPVNPSPSWPGDDFTKGLVAVIQYGYWFSGMAESDVTSGKVIMLPAPTWAGKRLDPTITATGMVVSAPTKVADAAWRLFEWYNGKEPAVARAGSGWGVPALKSMFNLMPSTTEFNKQCQRVLQAELALATPPLQFNPYLAGSTAANTWGLYLAQALNGQITFDQLLSSVETDVNTAIQEGVDRIG